MKVAISVPDQIFDAAEKLAQELHVSRSQLYAQALAAFLERRGASAVTSRLNEVYGIGTAGVDEDLALAQLKTIDHETW